MILNKDIARGCNPLGLIISLRFLRAIHLLCDRSVLCYPNVLFAQNPVSPGTFSPWHISVKINVIYPQPILDLWPPSIAEGWCSKLSYFYFLFKIICHIHELIVLFLKKASAYRAKTVNKSPLPPLKAPQIKILPDSRNPIGCDQLGLLYLAGYESDKWNILIEKV